jgi:uncharacterized protein (DUF58 family)
VPPHPGLILLAALLIALGSAQGWNLLHTLAYTILLTILLAYVWAWASVRWLYVRGRPPLIRSQVGALLDERFELENLSWLPRPWLEILDATVYPDHNLSQVICLGPLERRARTFRTRCRQRGEFVLGPVWIASGDPFGLFRRERQVVQAGRLVVFPATVDLPAFGQLPGELPGGSLRGERVHFTTPNVATVRDYLPGDSFNRVHWRSSARLGKLMVKEFERDPYSDVWLILDLDRLVQSGSAPDSTDEYAVTAAASLARHLLLEDRAVGVLTQGPSLPADRGPRQLMRLLEFLAVVRPHDRRSLDDLLVAEAQRFGRRDNLIILTPAAGAWISICRDLAARGVRSSAVVLDAASFGASVDNSKLLASLDAAAMPTYVVSRGVDLAVSLARPLLGRTQL